MPNYVAVNPVDHRELKILEERSDAMGDGLMCSITFPEEFRNVQAHYPILFQRNLERTGYQCLALFGMENGENLFLRNGKWDAGYIPLSADVLPFLIGLPQDADGEKKVVLDTDSPRVSKYEGREIFDDGGNATNYLESVSRKLSYLDQGAHTSDGFTSALEEHDLLEPLSIDVTLKNGAQNRLAGFHTIHEENLSRLDGAALGDIQAKGYLLPIYMAIASLSNLSALIDRKDRLEENGG